MTIPKITPLPTPPTTEDIQNFDERADDFLPAIVQAADEMNEAIDYINDSVPSVPELVSIRDEVYGASTQATVASEIALSAANAVLEIAGLPPYEGGQVGSLFEPVGAVKDFAGVSVDPTWIPTRGQYLLKEAYPELYAVVGQNLGVGSQVEFQSTEREVGVLPTNLTYVSDNTLATYPGLVHYRVGSSGSHVFVYIPYSADLEGVDLYTEPYMASGDSALDARNLLLSRLTILETINTERPFFGYKSGPNGCFLSADRKLFTLGKEGHEVIFDVFAKLKELIPELVSIERISFNDRLDVCGTISEIEGGQLKFISFALSGVFSDDPLEKSVSLLYNIDYNYPDLPSRTSSVSFMVFSDGGGYHIKGDRGYSTLSDENRFHRVISGHLFGFSATHNPNNSYVFGALQDTLGDWWGVLGINNSSFGERVTFLELKDPTKMEAVRKFNLPSIMSTNVTPYMPGFPINERMYIEIQGMQSEDSPFVVTVTETENSAPISSLYFPFCYPSYVMSEGVASRWVETVIKPETLPPETTEFQLPHSQPNPGLVRHVKAK